jgi:Cu+-exporting ATPase
VIEKLSHIDTIVFDKTGTLTRPNENSITWSGKVLSQDEKNGIFSLARQSTHPLSIALVDGMEACDYLSPEHFVEVEGRGIYGKAGSLEVKLGAAEYVLGSRGDTPQQASEVHVAVNDSYRGYFIIGNQYREGFQKVIHILKQDFQLYLVSGDNSSEAVNLAPHFSKDRMLFNQKPGDKADLIESLQEQGHTVLMTGDGLNDAGALMQSDVALTVANKVYHFSPASDAVLEAGQFQKLARFIRFTRTSLNIVKISFLISFLYNLVGIGFAITGNLSPIVAAILMPVSSVSVVAFATFVTRASARVLTL